MSSRRLFEDPGAEEFRGLSLLTLGIDQAWLVLNSSLPETTWLYVRSDDCRQCAFKLLSTVESSSTTSIKMDAKHGWNLRLRSMNESTMAPDNEFSDSHALCQLYASMGQFGVYDVHLAPGSSDGINNKADCSLSTAKEPVDIYMPLLACFLFFLILAFMWIGLKALIERGHLDSILGKLLKKKVDPNRNNEEVEEMNGGERKKTKSNRLKSLDTFRGISILLMIFVNDGGGGYWFFEHATWNGLLVADLVFPWFMWIMGVCLPIALRSAHRRKETFLVIFTNILRRSCILFSLGIILNTLGGWNDLAQLRIPGVLQRFAICYFYVATLGLLMSPRDLSPPPGSNRFRIAFHDVILLWPQWLIMAFVVLGHSFITFFLPVLDADCPVGYIGPAGLASNGKYPAECIGGAAGYIDRWMLTTKHIYNWPTARAVYQSGPYDPEGILGSLLSIVHVFLGVQAGVTLMVFPSWKSRVKRWLAWGALTGLLGALLCLGSQDDGWIPVNKNLWSLSYVLVTSSFAFILLSLCFLLIDIKGWWNGAPFFYPGMNGILMYIGHMLAYNLFPWHWKSGPMNTHFMLLVESLWGVSLWAVLATWLFHKKLFLAL